MNNFTRLFDIPYYELANFPKEDCLCNKVNGEWKKYSTQNVIDKMNEVSSALLQLGFTKGDKIAIVSNNRPEWNFLDFGMMQIGVINVPVYPTISEDDYKYIFNDAQVKLVFVSDEFLFQKVNQIKSFVPSITEIYSFNKISGVKNVEDFLALAKVDDDMNKIESAKYDVGENDLSCLIYTSGTTGFPKGVMLSHRNVVENLKAAKPFVPVGKDHRALSFLPLNHSFEKLIVYLYMMCGVSIYYAESIETIGDNLKEIKPHVFTAVPRLLEKVFEKIMNTGMGLKGIKRALFFWAIRVGEKFDTQQAGSLWYRLQLAITNKLIFSKWRAALGGNVICIVSGSAPLQPRLARMFWAGQIKVLEGYGLTETSPVISVNHVEPKETFFGSVGLPLPNVEVKIADDGELLFKGPNIMLGYYNKPVETREVFDEEGWFHSGDIGEIIPGGFLKITDRKKELFKTSGGKYVAPQVVENKLKESFLIEQAMIVGAEKKFVSALIVPSIINLKKWCAANNIAYTTDEAMMKNEKVRAEIRKIIDEKNKTLGHVEQVKKFTLVHDEWTPQNDMLTPTMKLKRKPLLAKYKGEIERIYAEGNS